MVFPTNTKPTYFTNAGGTGDQWMAEAMPTNPNPSPEKARRERPQQETDTRPLKMFVWDGRGKYKVCVCAANVAEARALALEEMSLRGDLLNMREHVEQEQPLIYHRPNAELALTENGETEELNICLEAETKRRQAAEAELAALKASVRETCGHDGSCEECGAIPTIQMPYQLCDTCREKTKLAQPDGWIAGFEACRALSMQVVDEHEGYLERISDLVPTPPVREKEGREGIGGENG